MAKRISKKDARELLWRSGDLSFLLHKTQLEMHEAFHESDAKKFVINCSRQLGKSYFLCTEAISQCLRVPFSEVKFATPTKLMSKQITIPTMRQILKDCPEDIRPEYFAQSQSFLFRHNGSQISVAGMESGSIERLRGTRSHLILVDEAGFASDLRYSVASVLLPQTLTTNGRIIIASTPPIVPRHDFETYVVEAKKTGAYITRDIFSNPMVTHKQIREFMEEAGGENSPTWKREFLAEFCYPVDSLVCPEFTKEKQNAVVREWDRPKYFTPYVSMDPGFVDQTSVLFGYWDFAKSTLVVEDEISLEKIRTDVLAAAIKQKETELWGNQKPYFRVSDVEPILLNDLNELHGLQFHQTDRDNKQAAINEVRMMVQNERLIISPKCRTLISHLESAFWDSNHEKFARVNGYGHFDSVDALIYLLRSIRKNLNPYPAERYSSDMFFFSQPSQKSPSARTLEMLFKPKKFSS